MKTSRLYTFFASLMAVVAIVVAGSAAHAQATTYPIKDLGNCQSAADCHQYCEVSDNHAACWSYEKFVLHKNVLGITDPATTATDTKLQQAGVTFPITDLGSCQNKQGCYTYCQQVDHHAACEAFASQHRLTTKAPTTSSNTAASEVEAARKALILSRAHELLGCNSIDECKAMCAKSENIAKCSQLTQGLPTQSGQGQSGTSAVKPGFASGSGSLPIPSLEPSFCDNPANVKQCLEFAKKFLAMTRAGTLNTSCLNPQSLPPSPAPATAACGTSDACRAYCEKNPTSCPGFRPVKTATPTPSSPTTVR